MSIVIGGHRLTVDKLGWYCELLGKIVDDPTDYYKNGPLDFDEWHTVHAIAVALDTGDDPTAHKANVRMTKINERIAAREATRNTVKGKRRDIDARRKVIYAALVGRDGAKCNQCGALDPKLQIDHIHPVSLGGTNELANLQLLCRACNQKKSNKYAEEH